MTIPNQPARDVRTAGFTLIELLVVIAILSLLLGMATIGASRFLGEGSRSETKARIESLKTLLEQYRTLKGDYPSTRLSDYGVKTSNGICEGIEAYVVALSQKEYSEGEIDEKWLLNTDGDRSVKSVTRFPTSELFEVVDSWENPIVYMRYDSYEDAQEYIFRDTSTDVEESVKVKGVLSGKTGAFQGARSFQLRSAGGDGIFGNDDDITSY